MAKVSIIVPIYNVEDYLRKCLDTLINQTFKDIEIWAVIDGSPDNSLQIVKEYADKDNRIKCIEKENGGYGSVLEYAVANIKSEYFLICDPDDWISEEAIESLYNVASKFNLDFVIGDHYDVYSNDGEEIRATITNYPEVFSPLSNRIYTKENGVDKFIFISESPHGKLFRTELAKNIEFPHKISYTDSLLSILFLLKIESAMYIDKLVAFYLKDREGNTVTDIKPHIADYQYSVYTEIMRQYEKGKHKNNYFYYRMFLKYVTTNSIIAKIGDKKIYKQKKWLAYAMLKHCVRKRSIILPYLNNEKNKKKYLAYKLLLNPLTSRTAFIYFSNRIYKSLH